MKRKPLATATPPVDLASHGRRLLGDGKWREAAECFKQLLKQDPHGGWETSLAQAYRHRAEELAGKEMPKEALVLLDNADRLGNTPQRLDLRLVCHLASNRPEAAATFFLGHAPRIKAEHPEIAGLMSELVVVLLLTGRLPEQTIPADSPWPEQLRTAREALEAYAARDDATLESCLGRIALRSPFKPLRLLLKGLLLVRIDTGKARQLAAEIPPQSPWSGLAKLLALAILDQKEFLDQAGKLSPRLGETAALLRGYDAVSWCLARELQTVPPARLPALLFAPATVAAFPPASLRRTALALLATNPATLPAFERHFGVLDPLEKGRLAALAREGGDPTGQSIPLWLAWLHQWYAQPAGSDRDLRIALIHRHIADKLLTRDPDDSEGFQHLEQSLTFDPGELKIHLRLLHWHEKENNKKALRLCLDRGLKQFPDNADLLHGAVREALGAKAFKKGSRLAKRLLILDPLHPGVRRDLVGACLAQTRKQIKSGRPDLAAKELDEADTFLRPEDRDGTVTIYRAFLAWLTQQDEMAETLLNLGIQEAGNNVAAWCLAVMEGQRTALPQPHQERLRRGLLTSVKAKPDKEAVLAMARRILAFKEDRSANLTVLMPDLGGMFTQALLLSFSLEEFRLLCSLLDEVELHGILQRYATLGLKKWPGQPCFVYYQMMAKYKGQSFLISVQDRHRLRQAQNQADEKDDQKLVDLIDEWLDEDDEDFDFPFPPFLNPFGGSARNMDETMVLDMLVSLTRVTIQNEKLDREEARFLLVDLLSPSAGSPFGFLDQKQQKTLIDKVLARLFDPASGRPAPLPTPVPTPRRRGGSSPLNQLNFDFDE